MLDHLGLFLIEPGEFISRRMVDAQQLVQLGVQRQIVAAVARWMNSVMTNTARVATAFQSNVARSNINQSDAQTTTTRKAAGHPAAWLHRRSNAFSAGPAAGGHGMAGDRVALSTGCCFELVSLGMERLPPWEEARRTPAASTSQPAE
ncbi:hypothetical protein [Bradyrhizobium sp.]|uniref:hypothetical protein n=1 Tax=Bradyrhizobium sp. TaxID=376 RepID=UPI003C488A1E